MKLIALFCLLANSVFAANITNIVANSTVLIANSSIISIVPSTDVTNVSGEVNAWAMTNGSGSTLNDIGTSANATGTFATDGGDLPIWATPGTFSQAVFFNGNHSYISLAANMNVGTSAFTFTGWVYVTNTTKYCIITYDIYHADFTNGWTLYLNHIADDDLRIDLNVNYPVASSEVRSGSATPLNEWLFIAASASMASQLAADMHIYTNAVESDYVVQQNGTGAWSVNTDTNRFLGRHSASLYFDGYAHDWRIHNRALSVGEINYIMLHPR